MTLLSGRHIGKVVAGCLAGIFLFAGALHAASPAFEAAGETVAAEPSAAEEVAAAGRLADGFLPVPAEDTLRQPERAHRVQLLGLGLQLPEKTPFEKRIDRKIVNYLYVPKRMWAAGAEISYFNADLDDYEFLVFKDWDAHATMWGVSPFFCYFFKDNMGVGARFTYRTNTIQLDNLKFDLGEDFDLDIRNVMLKEEVYSGSVFLRTFVGLGENKRFGLFNDLSLSYARGSGLLYSGRNDPARETKHRFDEFYLGIKPGLAAFITNEVSIEASVGMLGFKYRKTEQFENGERVGVRKTAKGNFKADLLSLNISLSIYL